MRDQPVPKDDAIVCDSSSVDILSSIPDAHYVSTELFVHHHVQDGGSTDGSCKFLASCCGDNKPWTYQLTFASEADEGMYDAINKGVAFATQKQSNGHQRVLNQSENMDEKINHPTTIHCDDTIIAWLNCDEQYLPGTLQKVSTYFNANPSVDILFGGMLMVDPQGQLLAFRKAMPMRRLFLDASYLYNYSCAMFIRGSFWETLGGLDMTCRYVSDEKLIRHALSIGVKTAILNEYLSVFTYSESNISSEQLALNEHEALKRTASVVGRTFKLPLNLLRIMEKFFRGGHIQKTPIVYEIYTEKTSERTRFDVAKSTHHWPDAKEPYLLSHRLK